MVLEATTHVGDNQDLIAIAFGILVVWLLLYIIFAEDSDHDTNAPNMPERGRRRKK